MKFLPISNPASGELTILLFGGWWLYVHDTSRTKGQKGFSKKWKLLVGQNL
jgi:hypothetical protein